MVVLVAGCGSRQQSQYVTYESLAKILSEESTKKGVAESIIEAARIRAEVQDRITELSRQALTAKTVEERTKAVMAACELDVSSLKDTLLAIQKAVEISAENLANVNTCGYKRVRVVFKPGGRDVAIEPDFTRGPLQNTGRGLDVTILDSSSFFRVELPGGQTGFTRHGCFLRDVTNKIVDAEGRCLLPKLTVPPEAVNVVFQQNGAVEAVFGDGKANRQIGQIELASFRNPSGLRVEQWTTFRQTEASGPPKVGKPGEDGFGEIQSGFLESSNVEPWEELVRLWKLKAWFDGVSKVVTEVHPQPGASPTGSAGKR